MVLRNEKRGFFDLSAVGINRSDSPRHLAPGEARIVRHFDFDRESKALVGRRGTLTLNDANALGGEGYDLHWTYNPVTGNSYVLCVYDDGANFRVGAWQLNAGETQFHILILQGGGNFLLTRNRRVTFVTAYNAALGATVVYGTNGTDDPFYWDFTHWNGVWTGAGEFQFGTIAVPIRFFCPVPWRGSTWVFYRQVEPVTVHWSDSDDGRLFIDQGNAGFLQAPMDDFDNPVRALYPLGDRMIVFNTDSIGQIMWTNNPDDPYEYRIITRGSGAIHQGCVAPWQDKLLFVDKREPYFYMLYGNTVRALDPERKIVTAIQDYVDWTLVNLMSMRLRVWHNTALLTFLTRTNADVETTGHRYMAAISLTRKGPRGSPYFPWSFYDLESNDILVADEGANVGLAWFSDARADPVSGNYYVRRMADFFDGANQYGDYNRVGGAAETEPVAYMLQTGFWGGRTPDEETQWKEFMTFTLDGDWEGTPAAGDVLRIRYRCEGWTGWNDILVSNIRKFGEVPFAITAQGRTIQFRFEFTSETAIPLIYGYGFTYRTKRIRR